MSTTGMVQMSPDYVQQTLEEPEHEPQAPRSVA